VQLRVPLVKQPSPLPQKELVTPVPSSQQTVPAGRQPFPHGACPTSQPTAARVTGGSTAFDAHAATTKAAAT
jgi:hypothetical protein